MLKLFRLLAALALVLATTAPRALPADGGCPGFAELLESAQRNYPQSAELATQLEAFAREYRLPTRVVELGPPNRRVRRLFVGLDVTNHDLTNAYIRRFNLDTPLGPGAEGTLALEFQFEHVGQYVTGALRPSGNPDAEIYRWGRPDMKRGDWWNAFYQQYAPNDPVFGYGHVIGLSRDEVTNVKTYLEHSNVQKPDPVVAPCKSTNCVAWTSSIELGTTKAGATDEERGFLFTRLGVSRAMAHFEIGRRLIRAANERHTGVIVFLNGQKGLEAFPHLENYLPPDPQIPYANILRGNDEPLLRPDLQQAIANIQDGAKIFFPIAAGASPEAVAALLKESVNKPKGYDVHLLVNGVSEAVLRKAVEIPGDKIRLHALFLGGNLRAIYRDGRAAVIPGYLSDFNRFVRDPKMPEFHYDAIVVRVSPPDAAGHYSLGPNYDMILDIIKDRPGIRVIAEVNPNVPFTTGENFLTDAQITAKFKSDAKLAGPPVVPLTDVERAIGSNLGQLVEDRATLQVGIGNVFGGLADGIQAAGRVALHVSTEMFGDPLKDLVERGIATDAETGFAFGSEALYKWLDHNPAVKFVSTEYVNDPGRVEKITRFTAINTALQVSLRGDVNATFGPDGVRMSSPGGQVEFMSGAARAPGGKAIIAIRSTAKDGEISSIVLDLYPGPVTTPHESVTHVVTEYGIARLVGRSERERAIALISIAHPKFRAKLIDEAIARKLIQESDRDKIKID